ncbi:UDP-N-acetylmuramyl tripeptide synthase [Carboxydothermus ferrireducens DSM 11255]|uniref:Lipid II isoglutaminyl synthase (glutamine-hydrolyzing) subunit MurT n=2 Tax=Carboxydothermus TaxID=129957 RepID=A0ABX2R849_9THEO|nr:UDP-N-acetylmuramyl tripeptide synthase [Carboxydothermus ferrireducens DSM 11255]
MMKLKRFLGLIIAKILLKFLVILKRGTGATSLPGKFLTFFDKNFLKDIALKFKVIVVTGSNGKTTTTRMIGQILKENGITFVTNYAGANLLSGIATALLQGVDVFGCPLVPVLLLEIDEATLKKVSTEISPEVLVVTNFFRDQLDRYGEVYQTLNYVKDGVANFKNTKLVLNADDSLVASLAKVKPFEVFYFGLDSEGFQDSQQNTDARYCLFCKTKYSYEKHYYGHLGHFKCPACGYRRPEPNLSCLKIVEMGEEHSRYLLGIKGEDFPTYHEVNLSLPGIYNIYNSLAALTCSQALGLNLKKSIEALSTFSGAFGRTENLFLAGKKLKIILVKNPAGFNQALNLLTQEKSKVGLAFLINDLPADGEDVSWLWDVNFEILNLITDKIKFILAGGRRAEDLALRLKYEGLAKEKIKIMEGYREVINFGLKEIDPQDVFYIFPTYTALIGFRKTLNEKFKLKEFWK